MSTKKEAVEIACGSCDTKFRLWIPEELLPDWGKGSTINCVKCGARYTITHSADGFTVSPENAEASAGTSTEAAAGDAAAPPSNGQETVLFVEDDQLSSAIAVSTLTEMGLSVRSARNAKEAIEAFDKGGVNLIVTDLHLRNPNDPESDMDGEELLQLLADKGGAIPTIVTTGKDMIDEISMDPKWIDLHVKGFIQKANPFWADELRDTIKKILTSV